ncbi:MAG: hypothetical protein QM582_04085 [Micropruina sp.]|uniref:hypothetical protein n=1 Tax=Micropruina sp. TaxID=2737536 RepID=UPI0039E7231E
MKLSIGRRTLTALAVASMAATLASADIGQAVGRDTAANPSKTTPTPTAAMAGARYLDPTVAVATNCTGKVGFPSNKELPGLLVPDEMLGSVCLPFAQLSPAPAGYQGDYRVKEFSFAKAEEALAACKAGSSCAAVETAKSYVGSQFRNTGTVSKEGAIDPLAEKVDLTAIRRPSFFGRAPYKESIAKADSRTYIFEMSAPADLYDQLNRGAGPTTKLRGWYLKGSGVAKAGSHRRTRALVIYMGGRTIETTAIQHPDDGVYAVDADGKFVDQVYPNATTEKWGSRGWRQYLYSLNQAGFDVLTFDKRGHGISGGLTADNVLNQGLDMLRAIDTIGTGKGLRVATPSGRTLSGAKAADALLGRRSRAYTMPILLGGSSQGGYATQTAMNANFNRWCSYDTPGKPCHKAVGHKNIKGAILLANLWGHPYIEQTDLALVGANAEINHFWWRPTSEPLGNIGSWPAVFFGKGIWDENGQTAGAFDAYLRARPGHKEIVYVRGPHSEVMQGAENMAYMQQKVAQFAVRTVTGRKPLQKPFATLTDALAASPAIWEVSTQPAFPKK